MNYQQTIKESRNTISDMTEADLVNNLTSLLSNEHVVKALGNIVRTKGKAQLEDNLMYRFKQQLMSGDHTTPLEPEHTDKVLLDVIKVGELLSNLAMHHDCRQFAKRYQPQQHKEA